MVKIPILTTLIVGTQYITYEVTSGFQDKVYIITSGLPRSLNCNPSKNKSYTLKLTPKIG